MPFNIIGGALEIIDGGTLAMAGVAAGTAYATKLYASGRKNIWERDWTGKLIIIAAPPTSTTLALIDHLVRLPSPPQVLYLAPFASPLPGQLLTILHTLRLGITSEAGHLHCEAVPRTAAGVRHFVRKWAGAPMGTVGEGGRRVDAIVLGGGWECVPPPEVPIDADPAEDPEWTPAQFQYHFVTAMLPSLLRAPPERDIRVIQLISPAFAAALPGLEAEMAGKTAPPARGLTAAAARRGVTLLLLQDRLRLVLDTLASASYSNQPVVPNPNTEAKFAKKRDETVQSNVLALSVVMPWARDEVVRPVWGEGGWIKSLLWILFLPFILIWTPSPAMAIQSVLHALSAPVKLPGDEEHRVTSVTEEQLAGKDNDSKKKANTEEITDPRRNGVRQGEVVRDCGVIDVPPVLHNPQLAAATYEKLEKEVEAGVRASEAREKAFPKKEEVKQEVTESDEDTPN